ncbi:ThiF family adenylyltransferase [Hyphomicrobium sp.]|uniref:ThiF family adenylyltransferase n=1 Tax=Hyphomicrobium sp. TaxID=82 RepID=UPI003F6ECB86
MPLHPWWAAFGVALQSLDELRAAPARALAAWIQSGLGTGVRLSALRRDEETGYEAVSLEVDVERPQDLADPIRGTETVAVVFPLTGGQPRVLALRDDFPDTPHQNLTPEGSPKSLCVDDRPWIETQLTTTPADLVRRIQTWLSKAASGDLHEDARPPDPLFFKDPLSIVVPVEALTAGEKPHELIGFVRPDNQRMIITQLEPTGQAGGPRFVVLSFHASPQAMGSLRQAPANLADLAVELDRCGIDLLKELRGAITGWAGSNNDNQRRLSSRLAIVVAFPVQGGGESATIDLKAFASFDTAGEIGAKLGVIASNTTSDGDQGYFALVGANPSARGEDVLVEPADAHIAFDRALATAVAGAAPQDLRRVVLVGAGAIGSQLAVDLAREGAFSWTVIDHDYLLPHNLARHSLLPWDVGAPKAKALARQLSALLGEPVSAAECNVMALPEDVKQNVESAFAMADVVLDASASVAVSRYLSDMDGVKGRRVCVFFNPAGTAVVVLAEGAGRAITMRDLEAQYHGLHLSSPALADHLKINLLGLRYSGSCRSLTNRIPATRAALLSAIAAKGVRMALANESPSIRVWTLSENMEVTLTAYEPSPVVRLPFAPWTITYDRGVLDTLSRYRSNRLPSETGGVLLGITDVSRRSIHVAHALPAPDDSRESVTAFERGVSGLGGSVAQAAAASQHQLRYVGEWHSHPLGSSPMPSATDLNQLSWLRSELEAEDLPAVMAIAADNGTFAFMIADSASSGADPLSPGAAA